MSGTSARAHRHIPWQPSHYKRGSSLGLGASSASEWIEQIDRGLSFQALQALESNSGITLHLLASVIGIPERTLARRRSAGKLAPEESERLLRISNIFEKCVELFEGDVTTAVHWLTSPRQALSRQTPLAFSRTELGAREV